MNGAGIFYLVIFLLGWAGFKLGQYKLYEKAGEAGWKALIPVYNWVVWLRLIGKPQWWTVLLLIPIVSVLVAVSIMIDLARAYGKYKLLDHTAALLLPFYFFPRIGFDAKVKYLGPPDTHKNVPKKTGLREWGDAILYAGVAALIIRTFFIEAFVIPTPSMERTLMAGDFLFVSKYNYGVRMPMIPLAVPFVHNKIKLGDIALPTYTRLLELPYYRLPGFQRIERNDIVVFNFPAHDIEDLRDGAGLVEAVSMKENYIKRCVGMPGDSLELRDRALYINGEKAYEPPLMQYSYLVQTDGTPFSQTRLKKMGFRDPSSSNQNYRAEGNNIYTFFLTDSVREILRKFPNVKAMEASVLKAGEHLPGIYPQQFNRKGELLPYNRDNFGPLLIPRKGMTVELTPQNIALYWRIITAYEGHTFKQENGLAYVDGQQASSYTFEMDYYFMMGDNRHNSADSRFFGFVPENHIVGRPLFVFMSYEKDFGVRFERLGTRYTH